MGFRDRLKNVTRNVWSSLTRQVTEGWLAFWLCYVITWVAPFLYALLTAVIIGVLNQLVPVPPSSPSTSAADSAGSPPLGLYYLTENVWELALWRLLYALLLYICIVRPLILYKRQNWPPVALDPFSKETMPSIIKHLRYRSFFLKCWAAVSVFLIIASLTIGIIIFVGADRLPGDIGEIRRNLTEMVRAEMKANPQRKEPFVVDIGPDLNSTISTIATRIGSVLILIFLVKVLVNLYRENLKLSAFYERWADAFQLAGTNYEELAKYVQLMHLERFDFEQAPKSPIEDFLSVAKSLGRVRYPKPKHD